MDGCLEGEVDGCVEGLKLGYKLGFNVGLLDGTFVGLKLGLMLGFNVGPLDGNDIGVLLGITVIELHTGHSAGAPHSLFAQAVHSKIPSIFSLPIDQQRLCEKLFAPLNILVKIRTDSTFHPEISLLNDTAS